MKAMCVLLLFCAIKISIKHKAQTTTRHNDAKDESENVTQRIKIAGHDMFKFEFIPVADEQEVPQRVGEILGQM